MSPYLSRLAPDDLLEGRRRTLYSTIFDSPGICFTDLRDATNIRFGVLQYHLETLERSGFVESVKVGKFRRYYPVGLDHRGAIELHAHAIDPGYSRILRAVEWIPGATNSELSHLFPDRARQSIGYRLGRLRKVGALEPRPRGRTTEYFLTGEASTILAALPRTVEWVGHCDGPNSGQLDAPGSTGSVFANPTSQIDPCDLPRPAIRGLRALLCDSPHYSIPVSPLNRKSRDSQEP